MPASLATPSWTANLDASQLLLPRAATLAPGAGLLLATDGQALYAFQTGNGARAWKVAAVDEWLGGVLPAGGVAYVSDGRFIRALRVADGSALWQYQNTGSVRRNLRPPVLCGGTVIAADFGGTVRGVSADGGRELWVRKYTASVTSDVVADARTAYYVGDGALQAVDAVSGALKWSFAPQDAGMHWADSSVVLAGGWVFATFGRCYALDPATGQPSPRGPKTFQNPGQQPLCSLAVDANQGVALYGDAQGHAIAHRYWSDLTAFYPDPGGAFQPAVPAGTTWATWAGAALLCVMDKGAGQSLLAATVPDWAARTLRVTGSATRVPLVVAPPLVANGVLYLLAQGDRPPPGGDFQPRLQAFPLPF